MQSVSSRIWTRVAVSISYDDNDYTTGTFMIHIFFNSLARSKYLSFYSLSFNLTLRSAGRAKFTIQQVLFFGGGLLRGMVVCITIIIKPDIGQMVRVFANGPGDQGSIPGRVIPKTQKMVLDDTLLNTQHYKGMNKG